jgi:soluble lytic murein transglycosylase-like protein
MNRPLTLAMTCVGLVALSCQVPSFLTLESGHSAIRLVDADSTTQSELAENEPQPARPMAGEPPIDEIELTSVETEILEELRTRHTGLAEYELILLAETIVTEADRHGLDPALVVAVIYVESSGYHLAVSPVGALGLMQILPATGEELARKHGVDWHGPDSLFDPIVNVKLGTAYLRQLSDRYQSIPTALAAYNWGMGRIDRRLRRGASVPSHYIGQVMRAYGAYDASQAGRS